MKALRCANPFVCALIVAVVGAFSFWVWREMPVYPDEIALMMSRGRFIQDHGVAYGLFHAVCASAVKSTPKVFIVPAWLLSRLGLSLSPALMRIIPVTAVLASFAVVVLGAIRARRPSVALIALGSLIGVAGSGMVLARHEFANEINLLACIASLAVLEYKSLRTVTRYVMVALLAVSGAFSVYVHIQGLLFLPLTALLIYRLLRPVLGTLPVAIASVLYLFFVTRATLAFQSASCLGHPAIEQFWREMTYGGAQSHGLWTYLSSGFADYIHNFFYVGSYAVDYLPPVIAESASQQSWLDVLNGVITTLLTLNIALMAVLVACAVAVTVSALVRRGGRSVGDVVGALLERRDIALAGIAVPVLFLFGYDALHNFYRAFYLNFIASIVVAIYLSRATTRPWRIVEASWGVLAAGTAIASIFVNLYFFVPKFEGHPGYEGPSISLNRDTVQLDDDIHALAKSCGVDVAKGGAIVDDLTYESLKRGPVVYPITYLLLQASLEKTKTTELARLTQARYALARCAAMNSAQLPYTHQHGELCCVDLQPQGSAK